LAIFDDVQMPSRDADIDRCRCTLQAVQPAVIAMNSGADLVWTFSLVRNMLT